MIKTNFAAKVPDEKPSIMSLMKRKIFGAQHSDLYLKEDKSVAIELTGLTTHSPMHPLINQFDSLAEESIQEIFECLPLDRATLRLVSKRFRKNFDDFVNRMTWINFLGCTEDSFSHWSDKVNSVSRLEFQLMPLAHVLRDHIRPFIASNGLVFNSGADTLRSKAINFIEFIKLSNLDQCLRLTDAFLKTKVLEWEDVYGLLFSNNVHAVLSAWSLGLISIAREMYLQNYACFFSSMRRNNKGVLNAIRGGHHTLSHFMLVSFRNAVSYRSYLGMIIDELIDKNYWDILCEVFVINKDYFETCHFKNFAQPGRATDLRQISDCVKEYSDKLIIWAAESNYIEVLREMDSLGLVQISSANKNLIALAVNAAISYNNSNCVEFFLSRLGDKFMSLENEDGLMPVHLAATSENIETLRTVLRLYPHYKSRSSFFSFSTISPLHMAVSKGLVINARIILERFPDLIYKKEGKDNNTVIHIAAAKYDSSMLEMLLSVAPRRIISALNANGDTALHIAADCSTAHKIELLMRTGYFTGIERNWSDRTPVYIHWRLNRIFISNHGIMARFNLRSEQQFSDAVNPRLSILY